jgi:hypothetical protein
MVGWQKIEELLKEDLFKENSEEDLFKEVA